MLQPYESLILTVPEVTQDEAKQLETDFDRVIREHKGNIISFERWGKYKLSYPVQKNEYGIYFLVRFEVPADQAPAVVPAIHSLFTIKLNNLVMRDQVTRLDAKQSMAYQRPKSLEESPASRDVGAFLKENKMEGLLSSMGPKRGADKEYTEIDEEEAEA